MTLSIWLNKPYYIRSRSSGKNLDVPGGSNGRGVGIIQWGHNGGLNQRWYFLPVPAVNLNEYASKSAPINAFTFEIVPYINPGMALDVPAGSKALGTGIVQWPRHGGSNQRWRLVPSAANGYVKIVSVNSGLVLDVPASSTSDGTRIVQWSAHGGANQDWAYILAPLPEFNVLDLLLGRWVRTYPWRTTVDVAKEKNGRIKVSWASGGGGGTLWKDGSNVWVG